MLHKVHTHSSDTNPQEIHFSTDYISNIDSSRLAHEVQGVLLHELVHCFQQNGKGKCPGGLIEGIAGEEHLVW